MHHEPRSGCWTEARLWNLLLIQHNDLEHRLLPWFETPFGSLLAMSNAPHNAATAESRQCALDGEYSTSYSGRNSKPDTLAIFALPSNLLHACASR